LAALASPLGPSEDEVRAWFTDLSNWNRWGEQDTRGTLNLITDQIRVAAARTVVRGHAISCAWDIQVDGAPGSDGRRDRIVARRSMIASGTRKRDEQPDSTFRAAVEQLTIRFHGRYMTHLDAPAHVFWDDMMYNGRPASDVTESRGAESNDVLGAGDGIITRGVLLDIARLRGVDALPAGEAIMPEELTAAEVSQRIHVRDGDALFVRTGDGSRRRAGRWDPDGGQPGLHAGCLPWLHERGVAVLAADSPQDVLPAIYPCLAMPIHGIAIAGMGMWLIDNCQLEDLADACRELHRYEFLLTVAPVRFIGATGSPVNPIAIF
jgi:kynurenine formamidase